MSVDLNQMVKCKCENCGEEFEIKLSTFHQRKKAGFNPGRFCKSCYGTNKKGLRSRIKSNAETERYSSKWGDL